MSRKLLCLLLAVVLCANSLWIIAAADEPTTATEPETEAGEQNPTTPESETPSTPGQETPPPSGEENPTEPGGETPVEPEPPVVDDGLMHTSSEAIAILKKEEGFSSKPYWDYAQWTVGYGTKCPDDMLDYYKEHGISEKEAEALLKSFLIKFETELHKFMDRTGVTLNQNQFDALLLFTYNCGSGWSYDTTGVFYKAIVSGATGNDLIYAFSRWCSAGGRILTTLLRRRLCEANMYLNAQYSQTAPANYGYVLYDACGGKTSPTVQGYDTNLTAKILSVPTRDGYRFDGWFTSEFGGTKVQILDASVKNDRLYAHWTSLGGSTAPETPKGVTITVTGNDVNVRSGPGTNHSVIGSANKGDQFVITETATGSGYTWGKFSTGWICLTYTNYDKVKSEQTTPETPQEPEKPTEKPTEKPAPETKPTQPSAPQKKLGTVKVSDSLRIRKGPSTGYDVVGYLKNGDRVEILEEKIVGAMVWGRISKGWISLSYVTLDKVEQPSQPESTPQQKPETENKPTESGKVIATGTVKVNEFLRIRSGPGTSYALVDYLTNGTKVNILETKESESMTWGKIDRGWISLDYVVLDKKTEENPKTVFGTVKVNDFLRLRSGAGTSYAITGYLSKGDRLEITEQKKVGVTLWGKTSKGWVSLDYVVLEGAVEKPSTVMKTVTADCLRIRSEAGTSYAIVGYLYQGAKVEILETKTVSGTQWGKTAKGWISMDYVK